MSILIIIAITVYLLLGISVSLLACAISISGAEDRTITRREKLVIILSFFGIILFWPLLILVATFK